MDMRVFKNVFSMILLLSGFYLSAQDANVTPEAVTTDAQSEAIKQEIAVPAEEELKESSTYVQETSVLTKYHSEVELEKLGKLELTQLYIERVKLLTETMPYLALNKRPAGSSLADLGIPNTKSNITDLQKESKSKLAYLKNLEHTLIDVTPYADKENIIWAIIFMEDTIHKAEKAANDEK